MTPFERVLKDNTIGNLWLYILTLAEKGPVYPVRGGFSNGVYGYILRKKIQEKFGFKPGKITSYRVLYRLEGGGFLKSKESHRKRVYFITSKGQAELQKAKEFYKKLMEKLASPEK